MTKRYFAPSIIVLFATTLTLWLGSCNKDSPTEPLEPISLISPDTSILRLFAGDSLPIEIKFTTDRPINWIKGMMDIDTLGNPGYSATYPDILFDLELDTLNPRVNRYTYSGLFNVPYDLPPFSTIRFEVRFNAGKSTFTVGQNYPPGIIEENKQFRIDVR
ncbi:MAG: hypothetical protein IPP77_12015 [Bacteroidetes bacterium]|nr:hypothetical protein [Bacteroidota bacterium]